METDQKNKIQVETMVNAPVEKVWNYWTSPQHIMKWNNASDDWHTPSVENDFKVGGKFLARMEARDGSMGFDFWGIYDQIIEHELIEYTLGDNRKVTINFSGNGNQTQVIETFEAEKDNSEEMQKGGWQSILDNFKAYVEAN